MYRKGKVHPSPASVADDLSFLPSAILALAAVLSADDKQILAYLLSCCTGRNTNGFSSHQKRANRAEHDAKFDCDCFNCYLSYWARWDNSPNRQVIHDIIEAYEEWSFKNKNKSSKKKKGKEKAKRVSDELEIIPARKFVDAKVMKDHFEIEDLELVEKNSVYVTQQHVDVELEKSMLRKISSFVGQHFWGFLGF
ncbi:hypothetical protein M5689_018610 [Euphorbia peplus]|nr:hypothetical protein M5689_018610 [Euphorbia peplus]